VTPVNCKLVNGLFQHHDQQILKEVGTVVTGPRSMFALNLTQMQSAVQEVVYGAVHRTADKSVQFLSVYLM